MAHVPPLATLRAFEATVRVGGLARAATELNISTSAVSHQIRGLEESLGARLMDRKTGVGGIRVTPAGAKLLSVASSALSLLDHACSEIRGTTARLTISANGTWRRRRHCLLNLELLTVSEAGLSTAPFVLPPMQIALTRL